MCTTVDTATDRHLILVSVALKYEPESWNSLILMPLRYVYIRDASTNHPKPMFRLSEVRCMLCMHFFWRKAAAPSILRLYLMSESTVENPEKETIC